MKMSEKTQDENVAEKETKPTDTVSAQEASEADDTNDSRADEWMLRPCEWYKEELWDCTGIRSRFNQYFVNGEYLDCSQWKIDYANCTKWKLTNDDEAYKALVASEKKRRLDRLRPHFANDVWTKRDKPPEHWDDPLPQWLEQKQTGTLLDLKQKALESGKVSDLDMKIPLCTIM